MTSPSDPWIIKLIGGVEGIERYPELMRLVDKYVVAYEPHYAPQGREWLWVTDDPNLAKGFGDSAELHRFYTQSIGVRPWDEKPDRPLTVFHIEVARRSKFMEPVA